MVRIAPASFSCDYKKDAFFPIPLPPARRDDAKAYLSKVIRPFDNHSVLPTVPDYSPQGVGLVRLPGPILYFYEAAPRINSSYSDSCDSIPLWLRSSNSDLDSVLSLARVSLLDASFLSHTKQCLSLNNSLHLLRLGMFPPLGMSINGGPIRALSSEPFSRYPSSGTAVE